MRKGLPIVLLLLSVLFLATVLSGCDSTPWVTPSGAAFASLRNDGLSAPQPLGARRAARRAAKMNPRAARPRVVEPGGVNIYVWSEPALGAERKVTPESGDINSVHLSADGTKGVFAAYSTDGYYQIYLGTVPAEGQITADPVQITTDPVDHWSPQISPSGTQVVYEVENPETNDQLCLVSTSGGAPSCLTIPGFAPTYYATPAWTPSGKIIVEAWDCDSGCVEGEIIDNIFIVNTDGSGLTQVTSNTGDGSYDEAPSVSADGTKVATAWYSGDSYTEIYVTDINTGARTGPLTHGDVTGGDSYDPQFVGNDQIVYVSEQEADNSYRLYVMPATGGTATAISPDTADNYFDYDYY